MKSTFRPLKIERSIDGRNFVAIGTVKANNTAGTNSYNFVDAVIAAEIVYYRLKSINIDGSYKYSKTAVVNIKLKDRLSIYPNPSTSTITIHHKMATINAKVEVFTIDGRKLLLQKLEHGATQTTIDVSRLSNGNYLLMYDGNGIVSIEKFNKQ